MPPAISDDEKSDVGVGTTPTPSSKREKRAAKYTEPDADQDDDELQIKSDLKNGVKGSEDDEKDEGEDEGEGEGEEEEDLGEDEYVVEKILSHRIDDDGSPRFEVKWEGFEKKSDRTWEPEENLIGNASAILEEYFTSIGGREKLFEDTAKALKGKKRSRQPAGTPTGSTTKRSRKNGDHPANTDSPASLRSHEFKPPAGSWEDHVDMVDMYRDDNGGLMVFLTWKNGQKTQHPAKQAYVRCPQKILSFYESKINFKSE